MDRSGLAKVGIDIGGTKIALGLVSAKNTVIGKIRRFEVAPFNEAGKLVDHLVSECEQLISDHEYTPAQIEGIGIGTPGPLDLRTGTVLNTPNMPLFRGFGLKQAVQERTAWPVEVNNDANVFVLGEALAGEAREGQIVIGVTLGTGYGCGIVLDKQIFVGATGTAAEIARCPYSDSILEDYVSGRGLSRMYANRTHTTLDGQEIAQRAQAGEEAALEAFHEFGHHVGWSFAWFVSLLDPDFIVVGGSISKNWEYIHDGIHEALYDYINPQPADHLQIVRSKLGESAAIIGAAGLLH